MADHLSVSVIIPHLNEPENLRLCLQSLDRQRVDGIAFEIIVVDNGSTQMPDFAARLVPGVRVLLETRPGPGPARNLGASAARAPLLVFIDADCVAGTGWLLSIVHHFETHPDTAFAGGDIRIRPADPQRLTAVEAYESVYSYRAEFYVRDYGFAASGNMAVRAEVFDAVGPFGGIGTMEDTEWGQRATGMGYEIAFLPDACVYTPSCRSFAELARRWDRHVAHEFRAVPSTVGGQTRWLLRTAVMALSPGLEVVRIMRSTRLPTWHDRVLALACVARVRAYRAWRMVQLFRYNNAAHLLELWNRESR